MISGAVKLQMGTATTERSPRVRNLATDGSWGACRGMSGDFSAASAERLLVLAEDTCEAAFGQPLTLIRAC